VIKIYVNPLCYNGRDQKIHSEGSDSNMPLLLPFAEQSKYVTKHRKIIIILDPWTIFIFLAGPIQCNARQKIGRTAPAQLCHLPFPIVLCPSTQARGKRSRQQGNQGKSLRHLCTASVAGSVIAFLLYLLLDLFLVA
jgi:hypothetical protein